MKDFLEYYDLIYEPIQKRYSTQAAQYYREKVTFQYISNNYQLKSKIDGQAFSKEKPDYDSGR